MDARTPEEYLAQLDEPRRGEIKTLHNLISTTLPDLEPHVGTSRSTCSAPWTANIWPNAMSRGRHGPELLHRDDRGRDVRLAFPVVAWALGEAARNRRAAIAEASRRAVGEEQSRPSSSPTTSGWCGPPLRLKSQ